MATNANEGHRRWGHINNVVGREKTDHGRPKRRGRNGGKPFVRFVDGLRTRCRPAVDVKESTLLKRRGFRTRERIYSTDFPKFGAPWGVSYVHQTGVIGKENRAASVK